MCSTYLSFVNYVFMYMFLLLSFYSNKMFLFCYFTLINYFNNLLFTFYFFIFLIYVCSCGVHLMFYNVLCHAYVVFI
jgi:hypothetical protein